MSEEDQIRGTDLSQHGAAFTYSPYMYNSRIKEIYKLQKSSSNCSYAHNYHDDRAYDGYYYTANDFTMPSNDWQVSLRYIHT